MMKIACQLKRIIKTIQSNSIQVVHQVDQLNKLNCQTFHQLELDQKPTTSRMMMMTMVWLEKNQKHSTNKVQIQYKHASSYLTNVHGDKRDFQLFNFIYYYFWVLWLKGTWVFYVYVSTNVFTYIYYWNCKSLLLLKRFLRTELQSL